MKKVLVGGIYQEANTFSKVTVAYSDFSRFHKKELIEQLPACRVFEEAGMKIIPAVYARILPSAPLCLQEFEYFLEDFFSSYDNTQIPDAVYLNMHGAMYIPDIGSGEQLFLEKIRQKYGWNVPIFASFDFHGNMFPQLANLLNYATAYKTAPHIDEIETQIRAAQALVYTLKTKQFPKVFCKQIPITLPGEMVLTKDYPSYRIINDLQNIVDDGLALETSWFCGFVWSDTENNFMSIAVTAMNFSDALKKRINQILQFIWKVRADFKLGVLAFPPQLAIKNVLDLSLKSKGVFLSDSGDNITAGAAGDNALITQIFMEAVMHYTSYRKKKILIAGITDRPAVRQCMNWKNEDSFFLNFGGMLDDHSLSVNVSVKLLCCGEVIDSYKKGINHYAHIQWENIDIILTEYRTAFINRDVFMQMGIDPDLYDVLCVKLGYLYPELEKMASFSVIALSPGNATLDVKQIPYKKHKKPFFPKDQKVIFDSMEDIS